MTRPRSVYAACTCETCNGSGGSVYEFCGNAETRAVNATANVDKRAAANVMPEFNGGKIESYVVS